MHNIPQVIIKPSNLSIEKFTMKLAFYFLNICIVTYEPFYIYIYNIYIYNIYIYYNCRDHWPNGRVFANGSGDRGSISGQVIPKTQKWVLDPCLLNTQHYKVRMNGKLDQNGERSSALPYSWV